MKGYNHEWVTEKTLIQQSRMSSRIQMGREAWKDGFKNTEREKEYVRMKE